ncbi:permease [Pseudodesulfovibrio indicus]|uniref:permease n=1 Tax=Pseudodesulfovibrio indicus TaxID=1716143 RepID=UPI00214EB70C|nr:permease [Pseudodesulfovibrio indicus]
MGPWTSSGALFLLITRLVDPFCGSGQSAATAGVPHAVAPGLCVRELSPFLGRKHGGRLRPQRGPGHLLRLHLQLVQLRGPVHHAIPLCQGAGLVPALAFMLSSTNLVVELGIIIGVFLSWQFVVGEYAGGILLVLIMWAVVRVTLPKGLENRAREHAREQTGDEDEDGEQDWRRLISSREGWRRVAHRYVMEWNMVWKDVTIGFTVAGIISAFVPRAFFQALFISSDAADPAFWQVLAQAVVGPVAAFFTFIGSMGNIPLAAVLFSNGVSFAGVMAFIFSDLVVFPVLRIQARYYGWKMALYLLGVLLFILVTTAVILHYGFAALDLLPSGETAHALTDQTFFAVDYTLALNLLFIALTVAFLAWKQRTSHAMSHGSASLGERLLFWLSMTAYAWLAAGLALPAVL